MKMLPTLDIRLTTGHLLTISTLFVWILPKLIDASCNDEQAANCRKAARGNNLLQATAGGTCMAKQYVTFTHNCFIKNYIPSNEHCCCVHDSNVMCCRYHQEYNHFRCTEAEDVIDSLTQTSIPLHIVLPCVLGGALVILLCCGICIYKCYEHHKEISDSGDPDYDMICQTTSCCCCCKSDDDDEEEKEVEKVYPKTNNNPREVEQHLLNAGAPARQFSVHDGSNSELLPSAPPEQLLGECHGMHRRPSDISTYSNIYGRQSSRASQLSTTCPTCASNIITIPPPTYEEHVLDPQVN